MNNLLLIRGIPGSGKSTLAKHLAANLGYIHLETDMFWENKTFNPKLLPEAHKWCQDKTQECLVQGKSVVVSNTFVRLWEMTPYFQMGFPVTVWRTQGEFQNIHGVPDATVHKMKNNFEDFTGDIYV